MTQDKDEREPRIHIVTLPVPGRPMHGRTIRVAEYDDYLLLQSRLDEARLEIERLKAELTYADTDIKFLSDNRTLAEETAKLTAERDRLAKEIYDWQSLCGKADELIMVNYPDGGIQQKEWVKFKNKIARAALADERLTTKELK